MPDVVRNHMKLIKPTRTKSHQYYISANDLFFSPSGRYVFDDINRSEGLMIGDLLHDEARFYRYSRRTHQKYGECLAKNSIYWLDDNNIVGIFGQGLHLFKINHEDRKFKCDLTKVYTSKPDVFYYDNHDDGGEFDYPKQSMFVEMEDHIVFYLDMAREQKRFYSYEAVIDNKMTTFSKVLDDHGYGEVLLLVSKDPRNTFVPKVIEVELKKDFPQRMEMSVNGNMLFITDPSTERTLRLVFALNLFCMMRDTHRGAKAPCTRKSVTYRTSECGSTILEPYRYSGPLTYESEERRTSFKYLMLASCCGWDELTNRKTLEIPPRFESEAKMIKNRNLFGISDISSNYGPKMSYDIGKSDSTVLPRFPELTQETDEDGETKVVPVVFTKVKTPKSLKIMASRIILMSPYLKGRLYAMKSDFALFMR